MSNNFVNPSWAGAPYFNGTERLDIALHLQDGAMAGGYFGNARVTAMNGYGPGTEMPGPQQYEMAPDLGHAYGPGPLPGYRQPAPAHGMVIPPPNHVLPAQTPANNTRAGRRDPGRNRVTKPQRATGARAASQTPRPPADASGNVRSCTNCKTSRRKCDQNPNGCANCVAAQKPGQPAPPCAYVEPITCEIVQRWERQNLLAEMEALRKAVRARDRMLLTRGVKLHPFKWVAGHGEVRPGDKVVACPRWQGEEAVERDETPAAREEASRFVEELPGVWVEGPLATPPLSNSEAGPSPGAEEAVVNEAVAEEQPVVPVEEEPVAPGVGEDLWSAENWDLADNTIRDMGDMGEFVNWDAVEGDGDLEMDP